MKQLNEADSRLVDIYKDFLPNQIFDAHMHLYLGKAIPKVHQTGVFCLEKATPEDYMADMLPLLPGVAQIQLNMMPFPDPTLNDLSNGLRQMANEHIVMQSSIEPSHVGAAYILPGDTEEDIRKMVSRPGIRCLKPYYYGAKACLGGNTSVEAFLPEAAWRVSNDKRIPIILHMMRRNLADPENFAYIERMTSKYEDAPLILAHCARGFDSWTAVKYIPKLSERDNIWFDLSAVCEVAPIMAAILKTAGKRTMWGSDWPICRNRGKVISLGKDQHWILDDSYAQIAAENLFGFYQAALLLDLDQTQIDDIFCNNAAALFAP